MTVILSLWNPKKLFKPKNLFFFFNSKSLIRNYMSLKVLSNQANKEHEPVNSAFKIQKAFS